MCAIGAGRRCAVSLKLDDMFQVQHLLTGAGGHPTIEAEVLQFVRKMSRKLIAEYICRPSNFSRDHLEFISRQ